jgi:hypothetical protein
MRPRGEALVGLGSLALLVALAAALGTRRNRSAQEDFRPSTLLSGPRGARGLADALTHLGAEVVRWRRGLQTLPLDSSAQGRSVLVLLDPSERLTGAEAATIRTWSDQQAAGDLVLAGWGSAALMRCFGYTVERRPFDSLAVHATAAGGRWPSVGAVLASTTESVVTDSSRAADASVTGCAVAPVASVDTLLMSRTGRAVALRLHRADRDGEVLLFADAGLLTNRALRETDAGPFALSLFRPRYARILFEEAHHGFSEGGSLAGATLDWSVRSPWGWAMWQVAVVGLLALFAGVVRFGPPRPVLERKRRSPLEHVRALATALAAARGHDVAIGAIVAGLRRRLSPAGQRGRGDWRAWLTQLSGQSQSPRARDAITTLQELTGPGQTPAGVLRAANAVEDVWEELRP